MANIPIANKHNDTAVHQHLVPQCYMREWSYNSNKTSVWVYERNCNVTDVSVDKISAICSSKPISNINYIDNYYDIKAGCYSMPQEALDEIFGPTMHLKVTLNGELLDTEKKRNDKFLLFDEWVITDCYNNLITEDETKELKKYFSEARFVFIEKEWSKQYENHWRAYIKDFEGKIRKAKACNTSGNIITNEMLSEVVKFLIIFDIRGFSSNEFIINGIDRILDLFSTELYNMQLADDDKMHPIENTVKESFKHQFILKMCYDILKNNTGLAKSLCDGYIKHLTPHFCLTDISNPFVTSERPAFINTDENGEKEHIFVALPTMLISLRRAKESFFISNLNKEEVDKYNKIIAQNNEYVISCTNNADVKNIFL
ncbi:MAG: DUF4238 domain-containing protein [Ruminococcus flavefaciens]|nr:DUF4238 domain-containing protein [Ruminococcus flavefaciens]